MHILKLLVVVLFEVGFVYCAMYSGPFNRLTYTPKNRVVGAPFAFLSTNSDPPTLLAYSLQRIEPGWSLATSEDGYQWKEEANDLMPDADEGDVISTKWFPGYKYLVAYNSMYPWLSGQERDTLIIGVVKDERLTGLKVLDKVKGRSPFFMWMEGNLFLGVVFDFYNIKFYKLNLDQDDSLKIINLGSCFKSGGILRRPRIFCFESNRLKCILMFSLNHILRQKYYSGELEYDGARMIFVPYIVPLGILDHGDTTSHFRFCEFQNQVLSLGWRGPIKYRIPKDTNAALKYGFTLVRVVQYDYWGLKQNPIDLSNFQENQVVSNIGDGFVDGSHADFFLSSNMSHEMDMRIVYQPTNEDPNSSYQICFLAEDVKHVNTYAIIGILDLYFHIHGPLRGYFFEWKLADMLPSVFTSINIPSYSIMQGEIKIVIDLSTITLFLEDGSYVMTQSYNLDGSGEIEAIRLMPISEGSNPLIQHANVTSYKSTN